MARVRISRAYAVLFLALSLLIILSLISTRLSAFVNIFRAHPGPGLTQEDIEADYNRLKSAGALPPEYVPRIIHQIYHNWEDPGNETLPADWEEMRQTCMKRGPQRWKYMLWTERISLEFVGTHYSWFLSTYESYKLPVQRIDALRYFLMRHFGGIYIDLDNGCKRDLEPLVHYPAWVTDGGQGTLSNNILGARADHPYWRMMTDSLIQWNYNYPFPYMTISYSSGQWYETAIWNRYHAQMASDAEEEDRLYRIMMDGRKGAPRWVFFSAGRGGSWDNWDNHLFGWVGNEMVPWIGRHIIFMLVGVVCLVATVGLSREALRRKKTGYETIPQVTRD